MKKLMIHLKPQSLTPNESGFITEILVILTILALVIFFAYTRVLHAAQ